MTVLIFQCAQLLTCLITWPSCFFSVNIRFYLFLLTNVFFFRFLVLVFLFVFIHDHNFSPEMTAWRAGGGVVPLTWLCLWPVQSIPCRTKGCRSTVLPPEAPTMTSRYLAKANQRTKVQHRCHYPSTPEWWACGSVGPLFFFGFFFKKGRARKCTHLMVPGKSLTVLLCVTMKHVVSCNPAGTGS